MPFLPESPRRLIAVGKTDQAKTSLRKIYGDSVTEDFLNREIADIAREVEISRQSSFKDFKKRENYWPLVIGKYIR